MPILIKLSSFVLVILLQVIFVANVNAQNIENRLQMQVEKCRQSLRALESAHEKTTASLAALESILQHANAENDIEAQQACRQGIARAALDLNNCVNGLRIANGRINAYQSVIKELSDSRSTEFHTRGFVIDAGVVDLRAAKTLTINPEDLKGYAKNFSSNAEIAQVRGEIKNLGSNRRSANRLANESYAQLLQRLHEAEERMMQNGKVARELETEKFLRETFDISEGEIDLPEIFLPPALRDPKTREIASGVDPRAALDFSRTLQTIFTGEEQTVMKMYLKWRLNTEVDNLRFVKNREITAAEWTNRLREHDREFLTKIWTVGEIAIEEAERVRRAYEKSNEADEEND